MPIHKGNWASGRTGRIAAALAAAPYVLAAVCAAFYALKLPFPIPRIMLPTIRVDAESGSAAEALRSAERGRFGVVELRLDGPPAMAELDAAKAHFKRTGMPVVIEAGEARPGPVAAWSLPLGERGQGVELTLLVDRAAARGPVRATVDGTAAFDSATAPPDRRIRVPLEPSDRSTTAVVEVAAGGRSSRLEVATPGAQDPRILLCGDREGRSALEAMFAVRKVPSSALGSVGFYAYDLVVLDGPDFERIGPELEESLAAYVERGAGSLFVVIDSPSVGGPGDAPAIERLLPVDLSPRSLSRLPDVAMAVAIDVSGSMYGEKLSLAKAVGLELWKNLKPTDLAGIMLFDDDSGWLRPLGPASDLDAEASLQPLRAGGGTRMYPAVDACLDALEAAPGPERRLVVVSDGISEPADFDSLVAKAFMAGISVTTMAVGDEYNRALLTRLAAGSGGRFYRVKNAWDVPSLIVEDRRSVSRTVFSEERVGVVDVAGRPAGWLDGMARLGPRPDALVFFSSEAGDPLLAARRVGSRSAIVYASDLRGKYGPEFLGRPATLSALRAVIGGTLDGEAPRATLAGTADGMTLSISGDRLVAPRLAVAGPGGRIEAELTFDAVAPGRFAASFEPASDGEYTLLVEDRGRTLARFPARANKGLGAGESDSAAAAAKYRPGAWGFYKGGAPWLALCFTCSLAATLASRMLGVGKKPDRPQTRALRGAVRNALLAAALASMAPGAADCQGAARRESSGVAIELSEPLPWRFNAAKLRIASGYDGELLIIGVMDDGSEHPLFRADAADTRLAGTGGTGSERRWLVAAWYGDGRLVAVKAVARSKSGALESARVELGPSFVVEAARARGLAALAFPYRPGPWGRPPETASAADASPDALARLAASRLFFPARRSIWPWALGAWSLSISAAAWALARAGRSGSREEPAAMGAAARRAGAGAIATAAGALAAGIALGALALADGGGNAWLFAASSSAEGGHAELVLSMTERDGYIEADWDAPGLSSPRFVALRSPLSAAIPVSAFDGFRAIRFQYPPLVTTGPGGGFTLAATPFAMAWGIDE